MTEEKKTYINVVLDEKETTTFDIAKDKSGIRSNSDFVRYLINSYAKEEVK